MPGVVRSFLLGKTDDLKRQTARYIIAGGVAFTVDFALLKVLTDYLNIHYVCSAAVGFTAGLVITYLLSIHWIFDRRKVRNRGVEFGVFTLIGVVGVGLTMFFIWLFTDLAGLHYLVSKIVTTAFVTVWNFSAKKLILF